LGDYLTSIRSRRPITTLVLAGPEHSASKARDALSLAVRHVFLFDSAALMKNLQGGNVKLGVATSVRRELWLRAELYPEQRNRTLPLTPPQVEALRLLSGE